jgi:hypothetical protein
MITPDTTLQLTLAVAVPFAGAIIVATWRAANYLRDMRDEVKAIRAQMAGVWTVNDMERWANRLERENRKHPLAVPDPLEIRSEGNVP